MGDKSPVSFSTLLCNDNASSMIAQLVERAPVRQGLGSRVQFPPWAKLLHLSKSQLPTFFNFSGPNNGVSANPQSDDSNCEQAHG